MISLLISDRFINAFKTALACLIGLIIVRSLNVPMGQWLIITILVVMSAQMHVGGALQKGYLRFVGTLIGAGIAGLTLWLARDKPYVVDAVVLLSALFFSYISGISQAWGQAGTLGAVTVTILLLTQNNSWENAMWRTGEILFGIVLALGVSVFVIPIKASKKWRLQLSKNLLALKEYYSSMINNKTEEATALEEKIMQYFLVSRKLQDEALNEPHLSKENKKRYQKILLYEKRLFRAFSLLEQYLISHSGIRNQLLESYNLIEDVLVKLANQMEKLSDDTIILPDLSDLVKLLPEEHFINFFLQFIIQTIPTLAIEVQKISK